MHDETYRMLGREHEADLEREAAKLRVAAQVRGQRRARVAGPSADRRASSRRFSFAFLASLIAPPRQPKVR